MENNKSAANSRKRSGKQGTGTRRSLSDIGFSAQFNTNEDVQLLAEELNTKRQKLKKIRRTKMQLKMKLGEMEQEISDPDESTTSLERMIGQSEYQISHLKDELSKTELEEVREFRRLVEQDVEDAKQRVSLLQQEQTDLISQIMEDVNQQELDTIRMARAPLKQIEGRNNSLRQKKEEIVDKITEIIICE